MDLGLHLCTEHPGKPATEQQPATTETNHESKMLLNFATQDAL